MPRILRTVLTSNVGIGMDPDQKQNSAQDSTGPRPAAPTFTPDDPAAEAGRRILRYHFERMQANEPGTRAGIDPEALHDMRVATRRMRAAIQLIGDYYEPDTRHPIQKGLKRTGRALGRVRDLDVLRINMDGYLADLPTERRHELDPVLEYWQRQHEKAQLKMLAYLESAAYRGFLGRMEPFVCTAGAGVRPPVSGVDARVRAVVPRLVREHRDRVLAYGPGLADAAIERLHALRIDIKRLRYTLEFFKSILGKEAQFVIEAAVGLQDHLGALNDAAVTQAFVRKGMGDIQRGVRPGDSQKTSKAEGAVAYLGYLDGVVAASTTALPGLWEAFSGSGVQEDLERAVKAL